MPVSTRPKKSKVATPRGAAKSAAKRVAGRAAKATSKRQRQPAGPVDGRAVRRAVGAAMFDPAVFMGLYERSTERRAEHWADVKDEDQQGTPRKPAKSR